MNLDCGDDTLISHTKQFYGYVYTENSVLKNLSPNKDLPSM